MRIPKVVLKSVAKVAAAESTRYAINGVRFKRTENQASAEALDGRMLIRARWTDDTKRDDSIQKKPFDVLLRSSALSKTKLPARIKQVELKESHINGTAKILALSSVNPLRFDDNAKVQDIDTIEGHFPDVNQVIPDYDVKGKSDCHVFAVDPKLLATLLDTIAKVATDEGSKGVRIVCPLDPTKPIRIDASTDDVVATGVLMPLNMGGRGYTAPRTKVGAA